jgi:replicative DNA helicase
MELLAPPFDNAAEVLTLGSVLLGGPECLAEVREILSAPSAFYSPAHGIIFAAALSLADRGAPVDAAAVGMELKASGQLNRIGHGTDDADGQAYLGTLMDSTPDPCNAAYYARIVKDKAKLRAMILAADRVRHSAFTPGAQAEAVLTEMQEAAYELSGDSQNGGTCTAAEAGRRVLERAKRVQDGLEPAGLPLGFPTIDAASGGGLRPGHFMIVAADTSVGKSSLGACFAANVAAHAHAVKVFSAEMTAEEISQRWLARLSGIPGLKIAKGNLRPDEWDKLHEAQAELERWGSSNEVTDKPMTVAEMTGEIRRFRTRIGRPVELVIIDYAQIVPGNGSTERERLNGISRGCKLMAMSLKVPVVLLSQLSRLHQAEKRPPEPRDLKETSNLEQDSDSVILLHPTDEGPDPYGCSTVLMKIAKMRNGLRTSWSGPSAIKLRWNPKLTFFAEYAREGTQEYDGTVPVGAAEEMPNFG